MGEAARATCRHCRRPIIACDTQLSHVGCSSGYGWIHAEPYWGHPCSPPGHWRDYARPDAPATEEDATMQLTEEQLGRLVNAAQDYDVKHRQPLQDWTRVSDHQAARLILGALGALTVIQDATVTEQET